MPGSALGQNLHFRRFWLGQTASNLGDAFGFVAMPLLVFEATHSVVQMGNVTAITAVGQVATATFAGVVVDRVHRRWLMIGCDAARALLLGSLPILAAFGALGVGVIYVVAFLTAVASNLFLVAYMAAIANLVDATEVAAANGRLQATQALSYVVGSALAGVVCMHVGAPTAIGLDALSFVASAVMLGRVRFRRERAARDAEERLEPLREIARGLRFLIGENTLRVLTLVQTVAALLGSIGISAAVIDLLVYRLKVDLSENSGIVGGSLALAALGAVLGALGAARLGRRLGLGVVCIAGTAAQGLGLVVGGLGSGVVLVTVGGMFWAGGLTLRAVAQSSLRQIITPDALLGRVLAAGWTLVFGASALGAVIVTRLGASVGVARASTWLGVALLVLAIVATFTPLASANPLPARVDAE